MRDLAISTVVALSVFGCAAPSDLPAASDSRPVVGHLRVRGRTIDLTVDALDARGTGIDLRRASAQHEPEVWADTDESCFDRDGR